MSRFWSNAIELLDAVEQSSLAGHEVSDWVIMIGSAGGIRMVAGSEWPPEAHQACRGDAMVYRISQQGEKLRIEGRAGTRTCLFEAEKPDGAARRPLADRMRDLMLPAVVNPMLPLGVAGPRLPASRG